MTNEEIYLSFLAGEYEGELPQPGPIRKELYLAAMCGMDVGDLPMPVTLADVYMYELALNGGGGGGGGGDLPKLVNPASVAQILEGYEAIDQNGEVLTGTNDLETQNARLEARLNGDGSGTGMPRITDARALFRNGYRISEVANVVSLLGKVTDMSYMFADSEELVSVDMSAVDTSEVTSMVGMFSNCQALERLDMSNWDTSNVLSMQEMFSGCTALEEIIGFSSRYNFTGTVVQFPEGTAGEKYALKRLTLRTDLKTPIAYPIRIKHCSMERSGFVEMANSLPDVNGLDYPYYSIEIAGNPCVTGFLSDGVTPCEVLSADDILIATVKGWEVITEEV